MCGNGQTVAITLVVIMAIASSAAAVGTTTATAARSRTGTTTTRSARTAALDFVCVVELCFAWIFRYPLHFVLLHFAKGYRGEAPVR